MSAEIYLRETPRREAPAVYVLIDVADQALYVGASRSPRRRIAEHRQKPWWPLVDSIEIYDQEDWELALHVERNLIRELSPEFNSQSVDPTRHALNRFFSPAWRALWELAR